MSVILARQTPLDKRMPPQHFREQLRQPKIEQEYTLWGFRTESLRLQFTPS